MDWHLYWTALLQLVLAVSLIMIIIVGGIEYMRDEQVKREAKKRPDLR